MAFNFIIIMQFLRNKTSKQKNGSIHQYNHQPNNDNSSTISGGGTSSHDNGGGTGGGKGGSGGSTGVFHHIISNSHSHSDNNNNNDHPTKLSISATTAITTSSNNTTTTGNNTAVVPIFCNDPKVLALQQLQWDPSVYSLSMARTGFGAAVVRYTTISTISTGNTNNATTDPFFDTREVILVTGDGGIGTSVRQRPVCYIRSNDSIRVGVHRRNCVTTD